MSNALFLASALERVLQKNEVEPNDADECRRRIESCQKENTWLTLACLLSDAPPTQPGDVVSRLLGDLRTEAIALFQEQTRLRDWHTTVQHCHTQEDFVALFRVFGLCDQQWLQYAWMAQDAGKPIEEGGIGFSLWGLVQEINDDPRWGSYNAFTVWMGKEPSMVTRVQHADSPAAFKRLFKEIGIPGNKWRSGYWLVYKAKLPPAEGGMGRTMAGLKAAITHDERFGLYQKFVAWMDGKPYVEPPRAMPARLAACSTPKEVLALFNACGVPDQYWRSSELMRRNPLPEGETSTKPRKGFISIIKAIYADQRWGKSYPQFVAWMDGKDAPDESLRQRVLTCETQKDFLQLFKELGIPNNKWIKTTWFHEESHLTPAQGGAGRQLSHIVGCIRERFGEWGDFQHFMGYEDDQPHWKNKIDASHVPEDFLKLFSSLGIPDDAWKDYVWMTKGSTQPVEKGGVGRSLAGLLAQIAKDRRFDGSYYKFVAWMEGAIIDDADIVKAIREASTPQEIKPILEERLGASFEQWSKKGWLKYEAHLPREQGGIGYYGRGIYSALCSRVPGNTYTKFLRWMDLRVNRAAGTAKKRTARRLPDGWCKTRIAACNTPAMFRELFNELRIPKERWTDQEWLRTKAQLPPQEGGIGVSLKLLVRTIVRDPRFSGYREFCAYIKEYDPTDIEKRALEAAQPQDMGTLLKELDLPDASWKSRETLTASATTEEKAVAIQTFARCVEERFGDYPSFVTWMNYREPRTYREHIAACTTPAEFRTWFTTIGIPEDKWRKKQWFTSQSKQEQEGEQKTFAGIPYAILQDSRFDSWDAFIAFMDGKAPPPPMMRKRLEKLSTPEDYLLFFKDMGIPGDQWRTTNWLENIAPLPPAQGGIGKTLQSVSKAIRKKFDSYPIFVAWMKGETYVPLADEITALQTQKDFHEFFARKGIPKDEWRESKWWTKISPLPKEQGGIGQSMSGYYGHIRKRFDRFDVFVAWMDGTTPPPKLHDRIAALLTPADFLRYFEELGVPKNKWRSSLWMGKKAKLPPEEGGIGKTLGGICLTISQDPRFDGYPRFVEWMDGVPAFGIQSIDEARALLLHEADKRNMPLATLLSPDVLEEQRKRSSVLKAVMHFLDEQQAT